MGGEDGEEEERAQEEGEENNRKQEWRTLAATSHDYISAAGDH